MGPVASPPCEVEFSQAARLALVRPRVFHSYTNKTSRPKTSYQFAYPVVHTWHKRLKLRPKLLMQVRQVSQTARPLPILDVQQSTLYLPHFVQKFPAMFCQKNGQGAKGLNVVRNELYTRTVANIPEKHISCEGEDEDHRQVVATIFRVAQDGGLKGKAKICLNFGPVWEATPLSSGSYEFVAPRDNVPVTQPRHDNKRFTFSVINPNARRHPVIASMIKNQLEVYDGYLVVASPSTGPITPSLGIPVVSDASGDAARGDTKNTIMLDEGLRTLIVVTGVWVACCEGWLQNFS
ncbi:hypothetical protein ASPCAL13551 [Aspergillus calidoustus]|uniref:Uncharacterized protein n=1 Tax=Aspergillus calidoustus TaxID=454130 RepID=A0A0U5GF85_ASPCI|nr:hypothetical protein ASPCAL13551 [Aspergillus calidoustus]